MQVSPLNSTSFKGINFSGEPYETNYNPEEFVSYEDYENDKINSQDAAKIFDKFDKTVEKINSNVHPATIITTALAAFAVAKTASKFVPIGRRIAAKAGEAIATGSVKVYGKLKNAIKKDSFDTEKITKKIQDYSKDHLKVINKVVKDENNGIQNLANGKVVDTKDNKMLNFVQKEVGEIFGEEKGKKARDFLIKHNIVNGAGLFDATAALAVGYSTVDGTSDITEETLDKNDLVNAAKTAKEAIAALAE